MLELITWLLLWALKNLQVKYLLEYIHAHASTACFLIDPFIRIHNEFQQQKLDQHGGFHHHPQCAAHKLAISCCRGGKLEAIPKDDACEFGVWIIAARLQRVSWPLIRLLQWLQQQWWTLPDWSLAELTRLGSGYLYLHLIAYVISFFLGDTNCKRVQREGSNLIYCSFYSKKLQEVRTTFYRCLRVLVWFGRNNILKRKSLTFVSILKFLPEGLSVSRRIVSRTWKMIKSLVTYISKGWTNQLE